jgi:hypothetical protein
MTTRRDPLQGVNRLCLVGPEGPRISLTQVRTRHFGGQCVELHSLRRTPAVSWDLHVGWRVAHGGQSVSRAIRPEILGATSVGTK